MQGTEKKKKKPCIHGYQHLIHETSVTEYVIVDLIEEGWDDDNALGVYYIVLTSCRINGNKLERSGFNSFSLENALLGPYVLNDDVLLFWKHWKWVDYKLWAVIDSAWVHYRNEIRANYIINCPGKE